MSMSPGTVTVDGSANYTGTEMAKLIMDAKVAGFDPRTASPSIPLVSQIAQMNAYAAEAVGLATAIVNYLVANASVIVPAGGIDTGLPSTQRTFTPGLA